MFDLARELGKTVGEIENSMTAAELNEWKVYSRIKAEENAQESMDQGATLLMNKAKKRGK